MTAPPGVRPIQRAGHIGYVDNRFCGRGVFGELAATTRNPIDLLLLAVGVRDLPAGDLELFRCMALCLCSPDARVWPLKLTRTLAAYGNPYAGFFGAQLANHSDRMGPGTASNGAASLAWIAALVGPDPDDAAVDAAVARHLAERGRIAGFGVPFRPEDERLVALTRMLADHPATGRRHWRLHLQVATAMRAREGLPPNIVVALAALLLDVGLAPHRAGLLVSLLMAPSFAAHAVEAADHGPELQELPAEVIDYQGAAPRRSPAETARVAARTGGAGSAAARRCLSW